MKSALALALAASFALSSPLTMAQSGGKDPSARAQDFAIQNKILQDESTGMPAGSPAVDKTQRAADPLPRATTQQQRNARAAALDRRLQKESTAMPAGSPPVDKNAIAADPYPKGKTRTERAAIAGSEEKFLEKSSTR